MWLHVRTTRSPFGGRLILALLLVLSLAGSAGAGPVEDYRAAYDAFSAAMQAIRVQLLDGTATRNAKIGALAEALNRLNDVDDVATGADLTALDPKVAKKLVKGDARVRKDLEKALEILLKEAIEEAKATKKARKKFVKATKSSDKLLSFLKKIPVQTAILFEKKARTAGIHPGGKVVVFKTFARAADGSICTEPPVVKVVNLAGNAVDPASVTDLGGGKFSVKMGDAFGAARIEITMCGATDFRFLQNDGTPPPPPKDGGGGGGGGGGGNKDTLVGAWSGTFSVTRPGLCAGTGGTWSANFTQNGKKISGTWSASAGSAGTISGTLSAGVASFVVGGGGGTNFQGTLVGTSISGNFTDEECPDGSGLIKGTFQGGKN